MYASNNCIKTTKIPLLAPTKLKHLLKHLSQFFYQKTLLLLNCQEMLEIILREMLRKEINEVIPLQLEVNEMRLTSPEQSPPNVVRITST